ncbi:MAG: HD-GYP domain-containing protein, partial [Fusobacteriota bacterium]
YNIIRGGLMWIRELMIIESIVLVVGILGLLYLLWKKDKKVRMYKQLKSKVINEISARDPFDNGHYQRISELSVELGKELRFSKKMLYNLDLAIAFTEFSKIRIPEAILLKRGKLNEDERKVVEKHPIIGSKMAANIQGMPKEIPVIVKSHHENYNGEGYPDNRLGDAIPLEARVIKVVDAYVAMISDRSYREQLPKEIAIEKLIEDKGSLYDPKVVDTFLTII